MEAKKLTWLEDDDEAQRMLPPMSASLSKSIEKPRQAGPVLVKAVASYRTPASPQVYPETTTTYIGSGRSRNPTEVSAWPSTDHCPSTTTPSVLLRLVLAVVVTVCLAWTIWLILLTVAPNTMVNWIMNTQSFDNGSFWLFVYPSSSVLVLAVIGLSAVGFGYASLLATMFTKRRFMRRTPRLFRSSARVQGAQLSFEKAAAEASTDRTSSRVMSSIAKTVISLTHNDSSTRKLIKIWMKIGDLVIETVLLIQILEAGSPVVLVAVFTVIVASNALVCAIVMFLPYEQMGLAETLIDLFFDLLIALGYPMFVLFYCLSTFSFDRAKLVINQEVFPAGWFEQQASVIADPIQTAVIYKSLKSLCIASILDFVIRVGANLTLWLRLRHVLQLVQDPKKRQDCVYPQRHRKATAFFIIFAVLLVIFVEESMRTSALACQPHPECAVNARRWTFLDAGSMTQCPCLTLIDRDVAPKSYSEWQKPRNVTEKVAQLATLGELQTVQLTNRYLPVLPEELARCTGMKHLYEFMWFLGDGWKPVLMFGTRSDGAAFRSLEYTHTQTLPAWIKTYTKLEFIHVESKFTSPMAVLPDDMFADMESLTFIHFAAFIPMTQLPSFQGLTNLKSLTLAVFLSLVELPDFSSLRNLERLLITCTPVIDSLPDLAPLTKLKSLTLTDRGTWCCNGFLGTCDLQNPMCGVHPLWGTPAATCLPSNRTDKVASPETIELIARFPETTCSHLLRPGSLEGPPTESSMALCNGTLYRQCPDPEGVESMCYNSRLMGIACDNNPFPIEMRRRQIARGVGDPCNPEFEAWLGCKKTQD